MRDGKKHLTCKNEIINIGEIVKYNGIEKRTKMVFHSMYRYLTDGKRYQILDMMTFNEELYYRIHHDYDNDLWYPEECFELPSNRKHMIRKYNLR